MTDLIPDEDMFSLPSGSKPGRILVQVFSQEGSCARTYRWDTEVLDYDNDSAVFWINEGVGFDYFFEDVEFPGEGVWVIPDITVSWGIRDAWDGDASEDWDWGDVRAATPEEIVMGILRDD